MDGEGGILKLMEMEANECCDLMILASGKNEEMLATVEVVNMEVPRDCGIILEHDRDSEPRVYTTVTE